MPDDKPGENIQEKTVQQVAASQAVQPPAPPDVPPSPPAQSVSGNGVERAIHAVEDRINRAEWLMIGLTAGIVVLTFGLVIVGILQWSAMRGQLNEMKVSGATATDQLWQAIGNMNWMARTADGSLRQAKTATDKSEIRSEKALNASIALAHNEQRAWVILPNKYNTVDFLANGPIIYLIGFLNVGKTPADTVEAIMRAEVVAIRSEPSLTYEGGTSSIFRSGELVPNDDEPPKKIQARDRNMPIIVSAERLRRIQSGAEKVEIYGQATYRDIAGQHWMRFCREVNTSEIMEEQEAPQKCEQYNSSGDGKAPLTVR